MTSYAAALVAVLSAQGILLIGTLALLAGRRATAARDAERRAHADERLRAPLGRVLFAGAAADELTSVLATLPPDIALDQLIQVSSRLPAEARFALASAARADAWVVRLVARHRSRAWWRRLQAARLLAIVAAPHDRDAVLALLADSHPAVRAAATDSLLRIADAELVRSLVGSLGAESAALRKYQLDVLRQLPGCLVPIIRAELAGAGPDARVLTALGLAEIVHDPSCLDAILAHVRHASADVRLAATRALRGHFGERTERALHDLLTDTDWRVRAHAARALGELGAARAIPALVVAVGDQSWWVRFRAALALAALGEPGVAAVRAAARMNDAFGREMAAYVGNLQHAALAELSE